MPPHSSRRDFLSDAAASFPGMAFAAMLAHADGTPQSGGGLHHPAKAKRVVQLFMAGGASHLDLFDFKPELAKRHGQKSDFGEPVEAFQDGLGPWLRPQWEFKPHGQCGRMLGAPVAALGAVADELAFVHNMVGKTGVHSQATYLQATGFQSPGFPGMGCWVSYGLGSMNDNLPTFVALPDERGYPSNGPKNWDAAFLPGRHAGATAYPGRPVPIADLAADPRADFLTPRSELATRNLLARLDREHAAARPADPRLEARLHDYELAARMQLAAPEAFDLSKEPKSVLKRYGLDGADGGYPAEINAAEETARFGRRCLAARRLLERGVRFVQVWSGNDNGFPRRNWDSHEDIRRDHGPLAVGMARGAAALIADLKERGLLKDTVVLWTTEFGRMPSTQGGTGRDHNPHCFTNWLCGGGVKGGIAIGPSDDFGFKPRDRANPTTVYDVHATILHLLGIDHAKLTVRHQGIDRRLTDVHGNVVRGLLA